MRDYFDEVTVVLTGGGVFGQHDAANNETAMDITSNLVIFMDLFRF